MTLRFRNHLPALESRGLAGAALTHGDVVVVDAFDTDFVKCEHIPSILHVNGRSRFSQTSVNANSKKGPASRQAPTPLRDIAGVFSALPIPCRSSQHRFSSRASWSVMSHQHLVLNFYAGSQSIASEDTTLHLLHRPHEPCSKLISSTESESLAALTARQHALRLLLSPQTSAEASSAS